MDGLTVGQEARMAGYVLRLDSIRGQPPAELERRLGFRVGRLAQGWRLLLLLDRPAPEQIELRGYTHWSDGAPSGHLLPEGARAGRRAEDLLQSQHGFSAQDLLKTKRGIVDRYFLLQGPSRIVKVLPVTPHTGAEIYPPGTGIQQWRLAVPLRFRVKALVSPGQSYTGDWL
jgi:hypothetical protein